MKIEHIAVWTSNIEIMKNFYVKYFNAISNNKYTNEKKKFESYFLSFESGTRLELMHNPSIQQRTTDQNAQTLGLIHLAFSVGSKEKVDSLTNRLHTDGFKIASNPRTTGDGYYESAIFDPEGNIIEITE